MTKSTYHHRRVRLLRRVIRRRRPLSIYLPDPELLDAKEKPTGAPTGAYSKCIREAVMAKKWTWPEIHDMVQKITAHAHENTMRLLHVSLDEHFGRFHIDVLVGAASFVDTKTVSIAEPGGGVKTFESFAFVVATGSKANRLPMIPFDLPGVYDSDTISQIDFIPKSMVVQGAGII
ncbi:sthA, partial [Symbiodinium sp. KB8]